MIFWGRNQLLLTRKSQYKIQFKDLPANLQATIMAKEPMSDAEARGSVEPIGLRAAPIQAVTNAVSEIGEQIMSAFTAQPKA